MSCHRKLIPVADNEELNSFIIYSILRYLLSYKHCEATDEGKDKRDQKILSPLYKYILIICWELLNFIGINAYVQVKDKVFP